MPNYRIRNVTTDYYLSSQDSTFISGKKKYSGPLPVIRVFGITESGKNTTLIKELFFFSGPRQLYGR